MKLPRRVHIAGSGEWRVLRRSLKHKVLDKGKLVHKPYFGVTNYARKTITISWGLTDEQVLSTFVHELAHAALPDCDEEAILRLETTLVSGLARIK